MARLIQDIRYSIRTLRRTPGYATVAVLTLALGIGATTAIYTVLKSVVLDPLAYPEPERLVRITNPVPGVESDAVWQLSPAQYLYYGENARSLDEIGMYRRSGANLTAPDGVVRIRSVVATASVLRLLGARAAHGRLFGDEDDTPEAPPVAVLSHAFWERQFGGDAGVIGQAVELNGEPFEVIGVMAPGRELPERGGAGSLRADLWMPYQLDAAVPPGSLQSHTVPAIARLSPGATFETAQAEVDRLVPGLSDAYPDIYSRGFFERYGLHTRLSPLKDDVVGEVARNLWMLLGAVGLVLLIATANVANLLLVRIEGRRRELSVRAALGASRATVTTYYLVESLVLSLAGGAVAVLFAYWGVEWLVSAAPPAIPRLNAIRLDATVFGFALGVSLCVAIGLTAVAALRHSGVDGAAAFAEGGRSSTAGLEQHRSGSALVVGQVALALLLVIGAGLLLESFRRLHAIDPGVDPDGVLTLEAYLPSDPYDDSEARWRFYDAVLQRVRALPGVTTAGVSVNLPFFSDYGCTVQGFEDQDVYTRLDDQGLTTCASQTPTSPGYFEVVAVEVFIGGKRTGLRAYLCTI